MEGQSLFADSFQLTTSYFLKCLDHNQLSQLQQMAAAESANRMNNRQFSQIQMSIMPIPSPKQAWGDMIPPMVKEAPIEVIPLPKKPTLLPDKACGNASCSCIVPKRPARIPANKKLNPLGLIIYNMKTYEYNEEDPPTEEEEIEIGKAERAQIYPYIEDLSEVIKGVAKKGNVSIYITCKNHENAAKCQDILSKEGYVVDFRYDKMIKRK